MREADLTRKLVGVLRDAGAWASKIHGNMYTSGLPDIIAVYKGVFLGLEVKLPEGTYKLTRLQHHTLTGIRAGGGVALVVTTAGELRTLLRRIDEGFTIAGLNATCELPEPR